jgi:hypothetical protein
MLSSEFHFLDELVFLAGEDLVAVGVDGEEAVGAVEGVADGVIAAEFQGAVGVGEEAADLELDLYSAVIEGGGLGVGGFLVVLVDELAPGGGDAAGRC